MPTPGPWVTPPEQVTGIIDEDGTILNRAQLGVGEPQLFGGGAGGAGRRDEAARTAYFFGDDISAINAATEALLHNDGTPPSHHSYSASNVGGHGFSATAQVAGIIPTDVIDTLSQTSTFQLAHIANWDNYYPPEYTSDPHVVGIEFDPAGGTVLRSWIAVAMWATPNAGPIDTAGTDRFESLMTVVLTKLPMAWEGTYYDYSGVVPRWFDTAGFPIPDPSLHIQGALLDEFATPGSANFSPTDPIDTSVDPLIRVYSLGAGDPTSQMDSHRNVPLAAWLACVRDGLGSHWPWVLSNTGAEMQKFWSGAFYPHGGVRYRPPRYRLLYDVIPPLRQFPRDDGLVGTSVARQMSGATSRQASIRQRPVGYL